MQGSKHAVILSGGGADGAYEVGVMKALFSGQSPATAFRPLVPDILTGTSIGSYNAAFLVSQWQTYGSAAIANLEQILAQRLEQQSARVSQRGLQGACKPAGADQPSLLPPQPAQALQATGRGRHCAGLGRVPAGPSMLRQRRTRRCWSERSSCSTSLVSSRANPSCARCMRRFALRTSVSCVRCSGSPRLTGPQVFCGSLPTMT